MKKLDSFVRLCTCFSLTTVLFSQNLTIAQAQAQPEQYCKFTAEEVKAKQELRELVQTNPNNQQAQRDYGAIIKKHKKLLEQCRRRTSFETQAMWLRVYPCDAKPGKVEEILDRIVDKGYNEIYLEVFYNSLVLLPEKDNRSPWESVLSYTDQSDRDLLAEIIEKGHERGMKVYAWFFTMNFGYDYALMPDRQDSLARNGKGQTSLDYVDGYSQVFVDPYSRQAQIDLYSLVEEVAKRKPDGVLFDYIRYPRGSGSNSVAGNVKDLWIYSPSSKNALFRRAKNNQGLMLIKKYVAQGYITNEDVKIAKETYPQELTPLWEGRSSEFEPNNYESIQQDLWFLSVAHAAQGVIDFLDLVSLPARSQSIPTGAVFFPHGNQAVGKTGFDSRLQPWDYFTSQMEWHPMAYSNCIDSSCIVQEIQRVLNSRAGSIQVIPAIAGTWGDYLNNKPPLELQMQAIEQANLNINGISHFAYSWQEPMDDSQRRSCSL
jgi:hypothetical protein